MKKQKDWKLQDIPNLKGKIIIITGANSGLGREATKILVKFGAHVIMATRDHEKATKAKEAILKENEEGSLEIMKIDLADLSSIRNFVKEFEGKYSKLDILINNAGLMFTPYVKTKDEFELQIGVNHLGHFALTGLLFDVLSKTLDSRIITMTSKAHVLFWGKIDPDSFIWNESRKYSSFKAYTQSKLVNLMFAYELDRKLKSANKNILSIACHPGWVETKLQTTGISMGKRTIRRKTAKIVLKTLNKVGQSVEMGSAPMIRAAVDDSLKGGELIGPKRKILFESRGAPIIVNSSRKSKNRKTAKLIWETSEHLTKIKYPI